MRSPLRATCSRPVSRCSGDWAIFPNGALRMLKRLRSRRPCSQPGSRLIVRRRSPRLRACIALAGRGDHCSRAGAYQTMGPDWSMPFKLRRKRCCSTTAGVVGKRSGDSRNLKREHCCDDAAVEGVRQRARLRPGRLPNWRSQPLGIGRWAMAANGGVLTTRIGRLLGLKRAARSMSAAGIAVIGGLCIAGVLLAGTTAAQFRGSALPAPATAVVAPTESAPIDSAPIERHWSVAPHVRVALPGPASPLARRGFR